MKPEQLKEEIKRIYGDLAMGEGQVAKGLAREVYTARQLAGLPEELLKLSHPCGNVVNHAGVQRGAVVLDLACGAGLDCFLMSRQAGNDGKVYGLELTKEMLAQAVQFRRQLALKNVQFLHGDMEHIPLDDKSVDVVTVNCGLSLTTEKEKVLGEVARVLKPGGAVVVADVTCDQPLPDELKGNAAAWSWCLGGAISKSQLDGLLKRHFDKLEIYPIHDYQVDLAGNHTLEFNAAITKGFRR